MLLTGNKQLFVLKLKKLTNQNDILRSNAVKVCIRIEMIYNIFSILV
jgi:hypothetical protein